MKKKDRAEEIFIRLQATYPQAKCELHFIDAYQLLVATVLSAQCTDQRVNQVLPAFFKYYPTIPKLAKAFVEDVEKIIYSTGFYHNKAKSLVACAKKLQMEYQGTVPSSMEELIGLPGVGRKTANVILGNAFGCQEGIVVDTHVQRLSQLMGLTKEKYPIKIEKDLIALYPKSSWAILSHLLIAHGRQTCIARRPRCQQ
ncbi:MAG: endonuclease III, partial [Pseudomonadota bacterium]